MPPRQRPPKRAQPEQTKRQGEHFPKCSLSSRRAALLPRGICRGNAVRGKARPGLRDQLQRRHHYFKLGQHGCAGLVIHGIPPVQPELGKNQRSGLLRHNRVTKLLVATHPLAVITADSLGLIRIYARIGQIRPGRLFEHVLLETHRVDDDGSRYRLTDAQSVRVRHLLGKRHLPGWQPVCALVSLGLRLNLNGERLAFLGDSPPAHVGLPQPAA